MNHREARNETELAATKAALAVYVGSGGRDPAEIARYEKVILELEGGQNNES